MHSQQAGADDTGGGVARQLRIAYWPRSPEHPYLADLYAATARRGVTARPASVFEIARGGVDVFHLHWPDRVWAGTRSRRILKLADVSLLLAVTLVSRRRFVVTVHNLRAHDEAESSAAHGICSFLLGRAHRIVALSVEGRDRIRAEYHVSENSDIEVIPLMDLRTRYEPMAPDEGHRVLGTTPSPPGTINLVWFGHIRPYKGLDRLVDLVTHDRRLPFRVLILGASVDRRSLEGLRSRVHDDQRFMIIGRHVTDTEICAACATAECAIFPFEAVENSASVLSALATDTPVIVPALGAMPELAQEFGSGWVRTYDPPLDAHQLEVLTSRPRPDGPAVSPQRSLDHVAMLHIALLDGMVSDERERRGTDPAGRD